MPISRMRILLPVVLVMATACGDNLGALDVDARDIDAGELDAPGIDAPIPGPVHVTVLSTMRDGAIDTTAIVLFADRDGVLIESKVVDGNGEATATMAPGGEVTVLHGGGNGPTFRATVIRGVEPGDDLVVGRRLAPSAPNGPIQFRRVQWPLIAGQTASYRVIAGCGSGEGIGDFGIAGMTMLDRCHGATLPIMVTAHISDDDVRFLFVPDAPFGTPGNDLISLSGTWQPMTRAGVDVTGIPPSTTSYYFGRSLLFDGYGNGTGAGVFGGGHPPSLSERFWVPAGVGVLGHAFATYRSDDGANTSERVLVPPTTATVAIDFAAAPLPRVMTPVSVSPTELTWTEQPGTGADLRVTQLFGTIAAPNGGNYFLRFEIVDDGTASTVALPHLPAAYAAFDPRLVDRSDLSGTPTYVSVDTIDGYDAARPGNAAYARDPVEVLTAAGKPQRLRCSFNGGGLMPEL